MAFKKNRADISRLWNGRGSAMFNEIIFLTVYHIIFSHGTHQVEVQHKSGHASLGRPSHGLHRLPTQSSNSGEHHKHISTWRTRKHTPAPVHPGEHPRHFQHRGESARKRLAGRGLIGDLVGGVVRSVSNAALKTLKLGHKLILPPLHGIEWLTVKATNAIGLQKALLHKIASTVHTAWKRAKAIEFPGKSIVALIFPNHIITIADKVTNDVMYIASETKKAVKSALAYAIYATLKVQYDAINAAIHVLGYQCIPLNKTSLAVSAGVINSVEISGGKICGLNSLEPKNNVTITHDKKNFLIVKMPWALKNLDIMVNSIDAIGFFGALIQNQSVQTTIEEVACEGSISFQKGTFLRFLSLHLELGPITGINIKLKGALEEGGTAAGLINGLAGALTSVVQGMVNTQLLEMEKSISNFLLGNTDKSVPK